ncbi:hypothetical protein MUP77_24385 [Candidatus Bathyarchaeota archaeon]|nr:hypothetical protein [Candidatus Bathyarchaeota archaeon]
MNPKITENYPEPSEVIFKGVKPKTKHVESRTKGTMILRYGGRFYKVIKVRSRGDNNYTFECTDIDTKQSRTLEFSLSGFLEAADQAFSVMKSPKDIFFLDLDNNGEWKVINENEITGL